MLTSIPAGASLPLVEALQLAREALFELVDAAPHQAAALHQVILPLTRALRAADTTSDAAALAATARRSIAAALGALDALPSFSALAASTQHDAARAALLAAGELLDHHPTEPPRRPHLRLVSAAD